MSNLKKIISVSVVYFLLMTLLGCSILMEKKSTNPSPVRKAPTPQSSTGIKEKTPSGPTESNAPTSVNIDSLASKRLDQQAQELAAHASTRRTEHGIIAELQGDYLFESAAVNFRPQASKCIESIAQIIKKYPESRLRIVSHTDTEGNAQENAELSRKRSEAVKRKLAEIGVPADVITTYGMGETQPIAANNTDEGRKKNRRVEIEITIDESSLPKKSAEL